MRRRRATRSTWSTEPPAAPPSFGASPHPLTMVHDAGTQLVPDPRFSHPSAPGTEGLGATQVRVSSEAVWRSRNIGGAPRPRYSQAMACDPTRGRVVMFGGLTDETITW